MKIGQTKTQIIEKNGKPVFAVIPYDEYIDFMGKQSVPEKKGNDFQASKLNDLVLSMGLPVRKVL